MLASSSPPVRVLLFEDNNDLRESLCELVSSTPELALAGAYPNAELAERRVEQTRAEVVLMDIDMPGRTGIEALRGIKATHPEVDVVMLTVFDDGDRVLGAVREGASGYLLKYTPPDKLVEAIREVREGGAPMTPSVARQVLTLLPKTTGPTTEQLSPQERTLLQLLIDGHSYKMVAGEMGVSINTVNFHIKNLYRKLHVNSASEAVALAVRSRLV